MRQSKAYGIWTLFTPETFILIQERLAGKVKSPYLKDINKDFPLRGFVACGECGKPLTASWSTGRKEKHPYYRCNNKNCSFGGKSIKKLELEGNFKNLLSATTPSDELLCLTKEIVKEVFNEKMKDYIVVQKDQKSELKNLEIETAKLLKLIMDAKNERIRQIYEKRMLELEERKTKITNELNLQNINVPNFGTALEKVFDFVKNPSIYYEKGDLKIKKTVLNLVFTDKPKYMREKGFGTVLKALPFRLLEQNNIDKSHLASPTGVEPVLPP